MRTGRSVLIVMVLVSGACTSSASSGSSPGPHPSSMSSGSTASTAPPGEGSWPTFGGDAARTGADTTSPAVGSPHIAWTSPDLDGAVYAQPLIVGERVLVATENDSVYALDVTSGRIRWRAHLGEPVPGSTLPCGNIDPSGITGTPVVDTERGVLYAVTFQQPTHHELVALDIRNGRVRFRHAADPPGVDPLVHQQRAALTISGDRVYWAFGGLYGDCGDYHGTVAGLSRDGKGPLISYRVPSVRAAGIWSPPGPAVDAKGTLFVATGNSFSTSSFDGGNAVIALSADLRQLDEWAPANWLELNNGDVDLGSFAPRLLPNGLLFQAGKEGVGYLLRRDRLGGIGGELFSGQVCDGGGAYGGAAVSKSLVYVPCTSGLVAVRVTSEPGFSVAWSATGIQPGTPVVAGGDVWTVDYDEGELLAFDANDGSQAFSASIGSVARFTSPAAVGGRLYVAATDHVVAFAGV